MKSIILIAHNLRSCHNVGSLLRTAEGLGLDKVYLTGYTPYPLKDQDDRLPYLSAKIDKQIHKTALGAEMTIAWEQVLEVQPLLEDLHNQGYTLAALEQSPRSIKLPEFQVPDKIAILVGREVEGVEIEILNQVDSIIEIPMYGQKESFNVVQAAAMALYHFRFIRIS